MIGKESTFFEVIGSSKNEYERLKKNISNYYYKNEIVKLNQFGEPKTKNGEIQKRILYPSKGRLKVLQKLVNSRILSRIELPDAIHGSVKSRSCITNARTHQGNKYFLLTDLQNYFPTIHFKYVYQQLLKLGFSPTVSGYITRLVTYDKYVPQGAPTSSTISNLIFLPQDSELLQICEKHNLKYTRYIDDLAFSSKSFITEEITQELLGVIKKSPFKYHHKKTKMSTGITEITGVLTKNNDLDAPKRKYEKLSRLQPESDKAIGLKSHISSIKNA